MSASNERSRGIRGISRRRFLAAAGGSVGAGLGFYTFKFEPHHLELVHRQLAVRALPASLAGKTLVQMSDLHVGRSVDDDYVLATFRRVAALRPDIVVFTGDFVSYHPRIFEQASAVYRQFPHGRMATLAILGNHDYGSNWAHPEIAERVVEIVSPFGIRVLRNEISEVEGFQIAGLDDVWAGRFEPARAIAPLDSCRAAIALSHNPDSADLPGWENYEGWILSGHTHGGQCKPPFLPPPMLPVKNRRYTAGEFALSGGRRMYINRGVGHLIQVRFNVRPEVTVFELRCA